MGIKEEENDCPPGFPPQCETRNSGGATSTADVAAGGVQSARLDRTESTRIPVRSSIDDYEQQGRSPLNSLENCTNRKRKRSGLIQLLGDETIQLPGGRPAPQAHASDALFHFNPIIDAIKAKHGDIDKDCKLVSEWTRKLNLFPICYVVKELQNKRLDELDIVSLGPYYDVVKDMERMNINVQWLHQRLEEIRDAIIYRDGEKVLLDEKNERLKKMDEKRKELHRLRFEIENLEDELTREDMMIKALNGVISTGTTNFQRFQHRCLTDGLI